MKSHWDKIPEEIQEHIFIIRLQKQMKKFLIKKKLKLKEKKELMDYLEIKALREGIMDPWWDYIDPVYGHLLVN